MPAVQHGVDIDFAKMLTQLRRDVDALSTRDVLTNASIGAGGITVMDGGSIVVQGTGTIDLSSGTLTAAVINVGTLNVSGSMGVGGSVTSAGTIESTGGAVNAGTSMSAGGSISAGGSMTALSIGASAGVSGADVYTFNGPGFNITGTRVAAWLESATGRVGTAVSSIRFKQDIVDSGIDPAAVLSIGVKHFRYKADTTHLNVGSLAEDLHAAGLWEFVIYEHDVVKDEDGAVVSETLRLGPDGQPIPFGIHYDMFALAVLVAAQHLNMRLLDVEERLTAAGL